MVKFKKILICFFVFFNLINTSFAVDKYLNAEQSNEFISVYNDYFDTSLPSVSFINDTYRYCAIMLTHYQDSSFRDSYFLSFVKSADNITIDSTASSSTFSFLNSSEYFITYIYTPGVTSDWTRVSKDKYNVVSYKGEALVSSNINPSNLKYSLFYTYSFTTKDFSRDIDVLNNQVSSLSNRVSSVENDVNDINSGIGGISGQLDTVISNQDKLYQDTNKNADDFSSSFPTVEIEDVTNSSFEAISNGVTTAFTSTTPVTVSFSFRGKQYNISSDQISVKNGTLLNFLTIVCTFGISYWLIQDLRSEIQKIQEGKIEKIANEDITANMV